MITEHDPNIRWAKRHFRLTFVQWKYKAVHEVVIGGNCLGLHSPENLCESLLEKLPQVRNRPEMKMVNPEGKMMIWDDDLDRGVYDLVEMLVGLELIKVVPEERG